MKHNIAFIFIGKLAYQGRILKQIKSLEKIGSQIILVLGNINNEEKGLEKFNFQIIEKVVRYNISKVFSFLSQLYFNIVTFLVLSQKKNIKFVQCCGLATLPSGVLLKLFNNQLKLIYDSTELSVERESGVKRYIWEKIQIFCLPYCDFIIQAEPKRLEFFKKKYNVDKNKLILIGNYPYLNKSIRKKGFIKGDKIKLLYFGILGIGRGYEDLIKAFKELPEYECYLIGPGENKYIVKLKEYTSNYSNIKIIPPYENDQIREIFPKYDIGFAWYENTNLNNYYCAPNKVYDYLNNGLPIITNNYPGLVDIIEKNRVGVCIPSITKENIQMAIDKIISENMNDNITLDFMKQYSWESQEDNYLRLFKENETSIN